VLNNLLDDGRLNRLLEQEALSETPAEAYQLSRMLDDLRRGLWSELFNPRTAIDAFRRDLQMDYLNIIDEKINAPARPTTTFTPPPGFTFTPPAPLSDDAKSQLRGELVTLRGEVQRAIPKAGDRSTQLHLQGSLYRIGAILDPKK